MLENIATWKFPRSLSRCAQCAAIEGILRQTGCHGNEI